MTNHDFEHFGEEIRKTIQDAVEYGNYDRLNQTITNTINRVTEKINNGFEKTQQRSYQQPVYQQATYKQRPVTNKVKLSTRFFAILQAVLGFALCSMGLFFLIALLAAIVQGATVVSITVAFFVAMFGGGGVALAVNGTQTLAQIQRFNEYMQQIGIAEVCNIADLVKKVNKPYAFVVKDVDTMIRKGWFSEGHLDDKKTCIILTHKMYQEYQQLQKQKELYLREEEQKLKVQQDKRNGLSPEVQKVIDQGDAYVKKIRECNDAIPGEEISKKIERIEIVVDKIFDRVEQNPNSISDIRKLMEYYLPTTVKLLEAYAQMDAQPVGGENIQTAKKEIEATLDTLNIAFEKLLDSLFQDAAWDVSSDISVLNTMLAQEGLKEDGLKKNGGK